MNVIYSNKIYIFVCLEGARKEDEPKTLVAFIKVSASQFPNDMETLVDPKGIRRA